MNQSKKNQENYFSKKTLSKSDSGFTGSLRKSTLTAALILVFISTGFAQLKIYINTDLEGISGVYHFGQTREKGSPANIQACEFFMEDLAAVIRGLRDGGATEIVVFDGHGNQSMLPHMMVPGATYITGRPKPVLAGLDSSFAGMVMLGFHAMNGTPDGVLHHTQSSMSENKYWYNGVESGELVQSAVLAGYYGVPFIMVTGDEATCRESRHFFGEKVVTVATKKGYSREAAELYPFDVTRKALYDGARKAISAIPECKPFELDFPVKAKKQYLVREKDSSEPKVVT
ncbi:MAG: M55 family metallopeptidase, partial [Prolixibacteraceae bacterium]|nr:M55 family metallopeptidase [Prolixibacteraceae bacterium]